MSRPAPAPTSWAEGEKTAIGAAIGEPSRVWFSIARGRLTEVFYPTPDRACIRSLSFFVAGDQFVSAEEDDADHTHTYDHDGVPLITVTNCDRAGRYRIEKQTIADPRSSVVLQRVRWTGPAGTRLYCEILPRLDNEADHNCAVVLQQGGADVLAAHRAGIAMAVACTKPWVHASAGIVDESDGRTDVRRHHAMTVCRTEATGQIALTGELALAEEDSFVVALAFAHTPHEAAHLAQGSLVRGYEAICRRFIDEWQQWLAQLAPLPGYRLWARSLVVLKTLEARRVDGGRVAALSTPWGPWRGPGLAATYHLVWTRDLVQSLGGLLAGGVHDEARAAVSFLRTTQHTDGSWPQNMLLDGEAVLRREELDETALPMLLVDLLRREGGLSDQELVLAWPMIQRAADHLVHHGPSTTRDRWEDTTGITPFTIATEIAALLAAAEIARQFGDLRSAQAFRAVAERWNTQLEPLLYRRGGRLAEFVGVDGYYVRARNPNQPFPELDLQHLPQTELSPDALALVRFGLRDPNDPKIRNTVHVIDAVLRTELSNGPAWYRYPNDEYGEYTDGAPFDGHGIGRPWPLLIGERAHYELARGDRAAALRLLDVMERCASEAGMLPEQSWDGADLPERSLYHGRPTGSAAPLGWAHAEYVKLCRSLVDGRVFDLPTITAGRR